MSERRHTKISINALGGQGGGVLANWIVKVAEAAGYIAQLTSVPGVAQRTGATIYYIELFPEELAAQKNLAPVLALMPAPGDVDIVLACEIMEAGRAITRGLVTGKTTLIASSHRVFAVSEKIKLGDGRQDASDIIAAAQKTAGGFILTDMEAAAASAGAVISAIMFGALAGSGVLPVERHLYKETIRASGRAVDENLAGFAIGFDHASNGHTTNEVMSDAPEEAPQHTSTGNNHASPHIRNLLACVYDDFPAPTHTVIKEGLKKLVDFQDVKYAALYLDRLKSICALDEAADGETRDWRLTKEVAKHLSLWMAFEDTIRVADLKTRATRFSRFRKDVNADDGQIVQVSEYMHPRVEEICDLMPARLGAAVLSSSILRNMLGVFFKKGRRIPTTELRGFLLLNFIGSLKFLRRGSLRYKTENARIETWLETIAAVARDDYALACEIAGLKRLIKGYGETHTRGLANYATIIARLEDIKTYPAPAEVLASLKIAALADEEGVALRTEIDRLNPAAKAA